MPAIISAVLSPNTTMPSTIAVIGLSVRYRTVVVGGSQRNAHMKSENCTVPAIVPRNTTAIDPSGLSAGSAKPPPWNATTGTNTATANTIADAVTKSGPWRINVARLKTE